MPQKITLSNNIILREAKFIVKFDLLIFEQDLDIDNSTVKKGEIDSYIYGRVEVQVEPGKYLSFFTKIDASTEEWISVDG